MYEQLLCHLVGDYFAQDEWAAKNKTKNTFACLWHCILYTLCFLFITRHWLPLLVIFISHFLIDRFSLAKYLIYIKNLILNLRFYLTGDSRQTYPDFEHCSTTGYYDDAPTNEHCLDSAPYQKFGKPTKYFITFWLYVISDNTLHLCCNYFILKYLI